MKITDHTDKTSLPGIKQVYRSYDADGMMAGDCIELESDGADLHGCVPLLSPALQDGYIVRPVRPLDEIRKQVIAQLQTIPAGVVRIENPERYPVSLGPALADAQKKIIDGYSGTW
jgi:nicotinate phosphoribosyltransferase